MSGLSSPQYASSLGCKSRLSDRDTPDSVQARATEGLRSRASKTAFDGEKRHGSQHTRSQSSVSRRTTRTSHGDQEQCFSTGLTECRSNPVSTAAPFYSQQICDQFDVQMGWHDLGEIGCNFHPDVEELESRYTRTLEWIAGGARIRGSASTLSAENSRLSNQHVNITSNVGDLPCFRSTGDGSIVNRDACLDGDKDGDGKYGRVDKQYHMPNNDNHTSALRGHQVFDNTHVNNTNPCAFSRDPFMSRSSHSLAVNCKNAAVSQDFFNSSLGTANLDRHNRGPNATYKPRCQAFGNVAVKKPQQDGPHVPVNYEMKTLRKLNCSMAAYDRNDQLSRSAVKPSQQVPSFIKQRGNGPNFDRDGLQDQRHLLMENLQSKNTNAAIVARNKSLGAHLKDTRQLNLKLKKAAKPEKGFSPAALMQHWFSKLTGRNAKTQANNGFPAIQVAAVEIILPTTTDEFKQSRAQEEPSKVLKQTAKAPLTTVHNEGMGAIPPANKGPTSKGSIMDAAINRFGIGNRSERQPPLHQIQQQSQNKTAGSSFGSKQMSNGKPPLHPSQGRPPIVPRRQVGAEISNSGAGFSQLKGSLHSMQDQEPQLSSAVATSRFIHDTNSDYDSGSIGELGISHTALQRQDYSSSQVEALASNTQKTDNYNCEELNATAAGLNNTVNSSRFFIPSHKSQSRHASWVASMGNQNSKELDRIHMSEQLPPKIANSADMELNPNACSRRRLIAVRNVSSTSDAHNVHHHMEINEEHSLPNCQRQNHHYIDMPDNDIVVLNHFLQHQQNQYMDSINSESDYCSRFHVILSGTSFSSMISAICYAWILQHTQNKLDGWEFVPVINMPRCGMWNHKTLAWLFEQAGLDTQALLFKDEIDLDALSEITDCKVSTIGQDTVRVYGEVASPCTIVAEKFFKHIEASSQPKCLRILLLAGLLVDTENLDFTNVFCSRRDERAAGWLLPGAGHRGRAMLLDELKQKHNNRDFYNVMCEKYEGQHQIEPKEATNHVKCKIDYYKSKSCWNNGNMVKVINEEMEPNCGSSVSSIDHNELFSEDGSSLGTSKSSKSLSSIASTEKLRLCPVNSSSKYLQI